MCKDADTVEPAAVEPGPKAAGADGGTTADPSTSIGGAEFDLLRSALYHDMRASWFGALHRASLFVTILLGSGTVAVMGADQPFFAILTGFAVAVVSAASLVWDFSGRARDHMELKRRFYTLLSQLEAGTSGRDIGPQMTLIYADEPAIFYGVNAIAHNAAVSSLYGDGGRRLAVPRVRGLLRHMLPSSAANFPYKI
ncbi:hypothetical protein [Halodurantibacterium flavum]|uniref:SLATT domain-containing protein n=1 Tax=Halodurantibacterium flavum TaxID=1382802 RepID=A0ABW4S8P3_9RHOB